MTEEGRTSTDAGGQLGDEAAGDARGRVTDEQRTPSPQASLAEVEMGAQPKRPASPRASPDALGGGSGAQHGSSPAAPPTVPQLGGLRRLRRLGAVPPAGIQPQVEEIEREPQHPWDAPESVKRTLLHLGDRVDVVEEEAIDPLTESLLKHVATVNAELRVSCSLPHSIDLAVSLRTDDCCGRR